MITHRLIDLRRIGHSAGAGRLRLQPWKFTCAGRGEPAYPRAEEASLPRADGVAWGWRLVACRLVFLLVIASVTYLYVQGATAFLQTFHQPSSPGSEWEALASVNRVFPSSPFTENFR